jgi:uncharacterized membrane protein
MKDDKSDPISYSIIFAFLLGIINFIIALFFGFHFPVLSLSIIFFPIAAILWGLGTVLFFKALQLLESSEVTILASVRSLVTIAAALLFLGETFSMQKLLGTIIILVSIFIVTNLKGGIKFNKGIYYTFGMALFYGLAIACDVVNLRSTDPLSYLAIINILIGIILLLIFPKALLKVKIFTNKNFVKKMLTLSIFTSAQAIAYYFALAKGPASQIAPIGQSQVIITILLAVIILKERDNLLRKIVAAILVMIGVLLLR